MVLFCTMMGSSVVAQNLFNVDPGFKRSFTIDLGEGESMKVEVYSADQLKELPNTDSLCRVFLKKLSVVQDSLAPKRFAKRIDMILDGTDAVQLRARNWVRNEENFVVMGNQGARLKYEMDTVTITGLYDTTGRFFRYTFYLAYVNNLYEYSNGRLHPLVKKISESVNDRWKENKDGTYSPSGKTYITAPAANGNSAINNMLVIRPSLDVQNYKDRFVPSLSLGLAVTRRKNKVYEEFGIGSELHFLFARDAEGNLKTYLNPFVTVSYGRGRNTSPVNPPLRLFPYISVSYLTRPKGNVYDEHTTRIGLGRFFLGNMTTKLEPSLYIDGFFKSATPSLRLVQAF